MGLPPDCFPDTPKTKRKKSEGYMAETTKELLKNRDENSMSSARAPAFREEVGQESQIAQEYIEDESSMKCCRTPTLASLL